MSAPRPRFSASVWAARLRRLGPAAGRTWYGRLVRQALALRQRLWPVALLLALASIAILFGAGRAGWSVFDALGGWRHSWLWSAFTTLAGLLIGFVVLEAMAAACHALMRLALRLCLDLGRHRILALIGLAALGLAGFAGLSIARIGGWSANAVALAMSAAVAAGFAVWFGQVYRRAGRRGFRDFSVDVVSARRVQDAHGL